MKEKLIFKAVFQTLLVVILISNKGFCQYFHVETFPYTATEQGNKNVIQNSGNFIPPEFSKKVYSLMSASRDYENILVLEDLDGLTPMHYDNALNNLMMPRTLTTTWSAFETEFYGSSWDILIINCYAYNAPIYLLDDLNNFVLSGGKMIFASWDLSNYPSHSLLSTLGISFISDFTSPDHFFCNNCSHSVFNSPNNIFDFYWTDDQADIDGQVVSTLSGATELTWYVNYLSPSVVLNAPGNAFFNAFQAINFNGDNDYDGKYDIQELIENQIVFLTVGGSGNGQTCETAINYGNLNDPEVSGTTTYNGEERWYKFYIPSYSLDVSVSLCGSGFDTYFYVYNECGEYELVSNDDYNCITKRPIEGKSKDERSLQSQIDFAKLNTGWYYVKIRGFGGEFGNYVLSVHTSNDGCLNAWNYGAVDDPAQTGTTHSFGGMWFAFDVPYAMNDVSVSLCGSEYDTYLDVYDECGGSLLGSSDDYDCDAKRPIETKDGRSLQSQLDFPSLAAGTYYAKVYGFSSSYGNYILSIYQQNLLPQPTNLTAELDKPTGEVFLGWDYEGFSGEGFYENFDDGVADNWIPVSGNWSVTGGTYSAMSNLDFFANTCYYNEDYSSFEYEVRLRKLEGETCNVGLWFNGTPENQTNGTWNNGYKLVYCTEGDWNLGKFSEGNFSYFQDWISSNNLNTGIGSWNIIKIVFNNGYIDVFINGVLEGSYYDNTFISGKIGLQMYDGSYSGAGEFDYVSLTTLTKDYVFGEINQPPVRNIYTGDGSNCVNCGEEITLVGTVLVPTPAFGNKYIFIPDDNRTFQYFKIYRDGSLLNTAPEPIYIDELPGYGTYEYMVTAQHAEGESNPAGPVSVIWEGTPDISVSSASFEDELEPDQTSTQYLTISNNGDWNLNWSIYQSGNTSKTETSQLYEEYKHLKKNVEGGDKNNKGSGTIAPIPLDEIENLRGSVQILAWVTYADMFVEYPNTLNAISQYFTNFTITTTTETDPSALAAQLAEKDVFLITEQETGGDPDYFANLGISWYSILLGFVENGGKVIVCGSNSSYQSFQILNSGGLYEMSHWDFAYGMTMSVIHPSHFITQGLAATITAMDATAFVDITDPESINLVEWDDHQSVAIKDIGKGAVIYLGYDYYEYDDHAAMIIANAVQFPTGSDWLRLGQYAGITQPGNSAQIELNFDATGLTPETYTAALNITSNDPDEPLVTIPVTLTVAVGGATTDLLTLNAGWNLVSLDVIPETATPEAVFAPLITAGNLEIVTGYEQGGLIFDPDQLPFLNTLTEIKPGFGYWVKVTNAATLNLTGEAISLDFTFNLKAGWNLVAYWPQQTTTPEAAFDPLITTGILEIVTGYEQGGLIFDPDQLPFLNTLTEIKNGFGYWVKMSEDYEGFSFQ
jgi:hypothetical protein